MITGWIGCLQRLTQTHSPKERGLKSLTGPLQGEGARKIGYETADIRIWQTLKAIPARTGKTKLKQKKSYGNS